MKPKVVIIGHGYLSRLSLIRSVAEIGCEVIVVAMTAPFDEKHPPQKPIDCYSKYVSRHYFCPRKDKNALVSLLLEKCTDHQQKAVLIPDGDDVVAAIDNHREVLEQYFVFPHIVNVQSSIEYWMEKTHQKQAAKEVGLNVAEATVIEIKDGKYIIPEGLRYPCFTKPLATMNGGKGGMRRCNNAKEVSAALDYFIVYRNRTGKVLVEDFKEIETEYALLGFSDGKEVVIPGILEFIVVSKQNKGIALQGKVMTTEGFEVLLEKFKQLVLRIGFVGVFDIDFYKSSGQYYFCEMNLRYGGSGYAVKKMGVNLPAMMVKHFFGENFEDMSKIVTGSAIYINERMCMDDWNNGYISLAEYKRYINSAEIRFIPDDKDPMPEKMFEKEYRKRWLKSAVKRLMNKRHVK